MTPLEQELTTRIARALEKIAEKDFGNKSISGHRITALKIIENTELLVCHFIDTVEEKIATYVLLGLDLDTSNLNEWREQLQLIQHELKS